MRKDSSCRKVTMIRITLHQVSDGVSRQMGAEVRLLVSDSVIRGYNEKGRPVRRLSE